MIDITPNYDLMLILMLGLWIAKGIVNILMGVSRTEQNTNAHGTVDVIAGLVGLSLAAWVIFG